MKVGIIDVDNYDKLGDCFPNLSLMKISAYHKSKGDTVEIYEPLFSRHCDVVYMSKVFSFTHDYPFFIDADKIVKGGTGYCIKLENGREVYDKSKENKLPDEIEHIMPDYSLYNITNKAYGFLTRGCPRGCGFCHVAAKEGKCAYKVANLSEFWNGQKEIILLDPNILACKDWRELLQQLIDSGAYVDFTQGLDIRLMTKEKAELLKQIKIKAVHFAFDRYQDKEIIMPKLKEFMQITGFNRNKVSCYVLCNYDTTLEQDLERIYFLKDLNINPYVMLYDKEHLPKDDIKRKLQRYCNMRSIFWSVPNFKEYV